MNEMADIAERAAENGRVGELYRIVKTLTGEKKRINAVVSHARELPETPLPSFYKPTTTIKTSLMSRPMYLLLREVNLNGRVWMRVLWARQLR